MRKLGLLLLCFLFLINSAYAYLGMGGSSVDVEWSFDSELGLPTEGERVKFNFILTPYSDNQTYLGFFYILDSPENQSYKSGVSLFPNSHHEPGKSYSAFTNYSFDSPGIWTLKYFLMNKDYSGNYTSQEIRENSQTHTKKIHVLPYYEANSIIISKNSIYISILGLLIPLVSYFLGKKSHPKKPDATKIDTISQLEKLAKLKDNGMLTDEEFTAQKNKLLSQ